MDTYDVGVAFKLERDRQEAAQKPFWGRSRRFLSVVSKTTSQ
jgi:hypothetical protein